MTTTSLDLASLIQLHKEFRANIASPSHSHLEYINQQVEAHYQQLKGFFNRMHWHSLRDLGQIHSHQAIAYLQLLSSLKTAGSSVSINNIWQTRLQQDGALIEQLNTSQHPDLQSTYEALQQLQETGKNDLFTALLKKEQSQRANWQEATTHKTIGLIVKSLLAILHGNINAQEKTGRWKENKVIQQQQQSLKNLLVDQATAVLELAEKNRLQQQQQLEDFLLEIYQAQLQQKEAAHFLQQAIVLTHWAQQWLIACGDLQQLLQHTMLSLQNNNKNGLSEKVGYENAQLGHLSRLVLSSVASAYALYWEALQGRLPSLKASKKLSFDNSQLPNGKNVPIHQLSKVAEGKLIETAGIVTAIEANRDYKGALVSRAKLLDPSSKKEVWIATLYTHLAHIGISVGAYVVVHGEVHNSSGMAHQELAVHIDRLELSTIKKDNWKFQFWELGSSFYQPWYNNLNMQWSLSEHWHDAQEKEIHHSGGAEFMFQPLYRSATFEANRKLKYS